MNADDSSAADELAMLRSRYRTLSLLSLLSAVLAVLVFWPTKTRLAMHAEPSQAPLAVDAPVVHLWK